jgi:uncharacterized SAM-dependent methyltransferase
MNYYKHTELVDKYHVSLKTVHNWIDSAKHGKLDIKLHNTSGRTYIISNTQNELAMMQLAEQGKKYRNSLYHKVAHPLPEFYELYSRAQILDIISNLEVHREIPRQYNYFDQGATNWDKYAQRLWEEDAPNLLKSTIELLDANKSHLDLLLEERERVNIIDVGVGNALPVKNLLKYLIEKNKLHRYIAIDISPEMLGIAKRNINEWFGDKVAFEGYVRDVSHEHFDDIFVDDMLSKKSAKTINLVLLLGGTAMNLRSPEDMLHAIYGSMGQEDLLVYTDKPDSDAERRYFNFNSRSGISTGTSLSPNHSFIFDLLNIDASLYEVEMGYNEQKKIRYVRVRLKVALTIKFKFGDSERNVELDKGETILLWHVWHKTALGIIGELEKVGFAMLHASMTKDRQYLLVISGVDPKSGLEL